MNASETNSNESLADRLVRLEELVSHQQHTLEQLNEVATDLQLQLEKHRRESAMQLDRLRYQISNSDDGDLPHEKPPHY